MPITRLLGLLAAPQKLLALIRHNYRRRQLRNVRGHFACWPWSD